MPVCETPEFGRLMSQTKKLGLMLYLGVALPLSFSAWARGNRIATINVVHPVKPRVSVAALKRIKCLKGVSFGPGRSALMNIMRLQEWFFTAQFFGFSHKASRYRHQFPQHYYRLALLRPTTISSPADRKRVV